MRYSKFYRFKYKLAQEEDLKKGDFVEFIKDFDADVGAGLATPMKKGYRGSVTVIDPESDSCRIFINDLNAEEEIPKKYLKKLKLIGE